MTELLPGSARLQTWEQNKPIKGDLMSLVNINIAGMTCGHCESAVTNALSEIVGVKVIEVSSEAGKAVIEQDSSVQQSQIASAIDDAGYELISISA